MRIISWNMNRRLGSWNYLIDVLNPDIALLQEASPIKDNEKKILGRVTKTIVKKNLNNLIYSSGYPIEKLNMTTDGGIGVNVSRIRRKDYGYIYAISIYGNLDFWKTLEINLLGVISLYVQTLRSLYSANHIVLAGDFNMDRRMDDNPTKTKFSKAGERRHNAFFDSIKSIGFEDCVEKYYPEFTRTHRHSRSKFPWQIDHMFVTKGLYNKLSSLLVLEDSEVVKRSDHNPIIADFT